MLQLVPTEEEAWLGPEEEEVPTKQQQIIVLLVAIMPTWGDLVMMMMNLTMMMLETERDPVQGGHWGGFMITNPTPPKLPQQHVAAPETATMIVMKVHQGVIATVAMTVV